MRKKIISLILAAAFAFSAAVPSGASEVVNEGLKDMALMQRHYYNTEAATADMTVRLRTDGEYEIEYMNEDWTLLKLTLDKKEWGVWNLGDWSFTRDGVENLLVGGATDWEYVFRILNHESQMLEFTGGNHGSEALTGMKLYDGVTGEELNLSVGEERAVKRLVIEEDTTLLIGERAAIPYANVHRKYTVAGNIISLDTKMEFVRNVQMALSYTAMASVNKDFGIYCSFDDAAHAMANDRGSFSGEYLGKAAAKVCTLSGNNPSATLTVGIFNFKDMTDNFQNENKTFLWDVSNDFTKLYFSKFSLGELTAVNAGEVWNLSAYWQANLN